MQHVTGNFLNYIVKLANQEKILNAKNDQPDLLYYTAYDAPYVDQTEMMIHKTCHQQSKHIAQHGTFIKQTRHKLKTNRLKTNGKI